MKRKIYNSLLNWKNNNITNPVCIIGISKVGKTYTVNEFCRNETNDYVYINLKDNTNVINIFESNISFNDKISKLEKVINKKIVRNKTVIVLDTINLSDKILDYIKLFSTNNYYIICTTSIINTKISKFSSKMQIEYMYPMDFEEFLLALGKEMWVEEIHRCYDNLKETFIHDKLMNMYKKYLCIGGMPEAVQNFKDVNEDLLSYDKNIIEKCIDSNIKNLVLNADRIYEANKVEKVYNSVLNSIKNNRNKYMYTDIEEKANKRKYDKTINYLVQNNILYKSECISKIEENNIKKDYFKLYLNDTGVITSLLNIKVSDIMLNEDFVYKEIYAKTFVAMTIINNNIPLYYWNSGNKAEVDFLIHNKDGIIPVEVKVKENTKSKSLKVYMEKYNPKYAIRISDKNFGYSNGIKSIPLYAAFCITKD